MRKGIAIFLIILGIGVFIALVSTPFWLPPEEFRHKGVMDLTEAQRAQLSEVLKSEDTKVTNFGIMGCGSLSLVSFEFTSPISESLLGEEVTGMERDELAGFSLVSVVPICLGLVLLSKEENGQED